MYTTSPRNDPLEKGLVCYGCFDIISERLRFCSLGICKKKKKKKKKKGGGGNLSEINCVYAMGP